MKSPIDLVIMPKTLPETSRAKRGYQGAIVSETPTLNELIPDIEPRGEDDVRIRGSTDRLPEAVFDRRGKVNLRPLADPIAKRGASWAAPARQRTIEWHTGRRPIRQITRRRRNMGTADRLRGRTKLIIIAVRRASAHRGIPRIMHRQERNARALYDEFFWFTQIASIFNVRDLESLTGVRPPVKFPFLRPELSCVVRIRPMTACRNIGGTLTECVRRSTAQSKERGGVVSRRCESAMLYER